jgi:hypothetical protein
MAVDLDVREVRVLATDLGRVSARVAPEVKRSVSKSALNLKTQMQREMSASTHFGQIARSINYDITTDGDGLGAEVGPDKSRFGGALANIAYFGTSRGGGTVPDPAGALGQEAGAFESWLSRIVGDAL